MRIMEHFDMNNTFFFVNKTERFFPKLNYRKDTIPVGNSIMMCLAVAWSPLDRGRNYDLMKQIKDFPRCAATESGKFIWNDDDPVFGIDVPVWTQHVYDVDCTDEEECDKYCDTYYNAEYVNGVKGKKCYSYDVLDNICIVVEYDANTNEYRYIGGCFKDNIHYMMTPAEQNRDYHFSDLEIEVRNKKDPIIRAGELSDYTYNFGEEWVTMHLTIRTFWLFFSIL